MRLLCLLAAGLLILFPGPSPAQKAKEKEKEADTRILEIGGKTLEQWIAEIPAKDRSKGENAIRTVLMFGPDRAYKAVPVLLKELKKHTATVPIDTSIRVNVIIALGVIVGGANEPDPKLVQDAVLTIMRFLRDGQSIVKFRAAEALGKIGPDAKVAIPELITTVKDPATWETRVAACQALGTVAYEEKLGPSLLVLNALYGALGDPASEVRMKAIQSLTWLGPPANPALRLGLEKALEPVALRDPELKVQIWANMAIMSITGSITPERLAPIVKLLKEKDIHIQIQAAQALGTVGTKAKSAIPALMENLTDEQPIVVYWSAWALGKMETWAMDAVPALEKIQKDSKLPEPVKKAAEESIAMIKGKKTPSK